MCCHIELSLLLVVLRQEKKKAMCACESTRVMRYSVSEKFGVNAMCGERKRKDICFDIGLICTVLMPLNLLQIGFGG